MKILSVFALLLVIFSCTKTPPKKSFPLPQTLTEALQSPSRNPENVKRDMFRHPQETLEFFGLKPEMTVVEITPGSGWYTEILAPYLVSRGKYIMAVPELTKESPAYAIENDKKVRAILAVNKEVESKTIKAPFDPLNKDIVEPGTADLVLTFRNVHNWIGNNSAQAAFNAFYRALKPGGTLGVVEHSGRGKKIDPKSGYMSEKDVMDLAKKAGFKFIARSDINANPKDTTVHEGGVWSLPPSLRLGEKDREKYQAIGESNRMTLKFMKPLK